MNLHNDIKFFTETIRAAAQYLKIREDFVEKDYWITLVLNRLANSGYAGTAVFKGGTSLSKGFGLIDRFSEDVDVAIVDVGDRSGNEIKNIIRTLEKEMTQELNETEVDGITSKGSRFRKSVFEYESTDTKNKNNKLIVEINSFANPYPFQLLPIKSMVYDFLKQTGKTEFIEKFDLHPFKVQVLNKEQTMLEKLVSLIRFSYGEPPETGISEKIRHFYDLHFLVNDAECAKFVQSGDFNRQFNAILEHDREIFDEPEGWKTKQLAESPLMSDFENIWDAIKGTYNRELSALAYTPIPDEKIIAHSFSNLVKMIK